MCRRSLVMKNNTGGGRGCFGRRPTWDRKQRWMRDECDENPTVNSMPRGLKYSAGHSHDDDLDSVVLVGVVGVSNASSLGRLSLVKSSFDHDLPATWISPQRPWRYHDNMTEVKGKSTPISTAITDLTPLTRDESKWFMRGTGMCGWLAMTGRPDIKYAHSRIMLTYPAVSILYIWPSCHG